MLQKNFEEDQVQRQDAAKFGDSVESGSAGDSWGTRRRDGNNQEQPQPRVPSTLGMLQLHRTKLGHFIYQSRSGNLFPKSKINKKRSKSYSIGSNCSLFP